MFLPNITIVIKSSFIIRSETFQIQIVEPSELIYQLVFKGFLFCVIEEGGGDGTMQFLMAFNMNLMTLFIPDKMCFHVRRSLLLGVERDWHLPPPVDVARLPLVGRASRR